MKISILVFGSNNFLATLPDHIRNTTAYILEVITDAHQAVAHIQITPPDIILVQASLDGSIQLCGWLKEQTQLSWIYSIFLEDRPEELANRSKYGWEWELQMTAIILNQGADAYIWQLPEDKIGHSWTGSTATEYLILAHLTVGLRKAQKYRDLIQKNDLLSAIALADSLTELNNRRALEWDLPRQIQKAQNHGIPLSLIILDVDYFKKVNDTYGHLVGDRLLQLLCSRLRHNLRSQDTAFRYGGEEFVVVLAHTTGNEALLVADRLNRVVSEQPFVINSQLTIDITISLGTASLEVGDDDKGLSLLHRADQCLFHAKATGRNQAISWEYLSRFSHLQAVSS
ncbi:GGDEF domain-containing protein [Nostocaceae cyanobacterium CENA357]|uniref:GGDEF domain-containing protein n=1 Tax=Atlanticothrix silvestris CENA357 TaxID=1725252 RepID=A0A8J7L489_9CYAN|nr:GGDEF domain-containing protein [Atlanticothrix silvestris]MBH8553382.1 GGDEF domain-containing protein [Atlanticothrix silvestris CENA357]